MRVPLPSLPVTATGAARPETSKCRGGGSSSRSENDPPPAVHRHPLQHRWDQGQAPSQPPHPRQQHGAAQGVDGGAPAVAQQSRGRLGAANAAAAPHVSINPLFEPSSGGSAQPVCESVSLAAAGEAAPRHAAAAPIRAAAGAGSSAGRDCAAGPVIPPIRTTCDRGLSGARAAGPNSPAPGTPTGQILIPMLRSGRSLNRTISDCDAAGTSSPMARGSPLALPWSPFAPAAARQQEGVVGPTGPSDARQDRHGGALAGPSRGFRLCPGRQRQRCRSCPPGTRRCHWQEMNAAPCSGLEHTATGCGAGGTKGNAAAWAWRPHLLRHHSDVGCRAAAATAATAASLSSKAVGAAGKQHSQIGATDAATAGNAGSACVLRRGAATAKGSGWHAGPAAPCWPPLGVLYLKLRRGVPDLGFEPDLFRMTFRLTGECNLWASCRPAVPVGSWPAC